MAVFERLRIHGECLIGVEDHEVGIESRRDLPLAASKADELGGSCGHPLDHLLERNAARFVPGLSRRGLFKKPRHWDRIFPFFESSLDEQAAIAMTKLVALSKPK